MRRVNIIPFFLLVSLLFVTGGTAADAADLPVTSNFGWRVHPIYGDWRFHTGVDFGYPEGTAIPALMDGQVILAGNYSDGYGNQVLLYHYGNDTYTRYAHCSVVYVSAGTTVAAGECIALVGQTGNVTGPHLHLEYIIRDGTGEFAYTDPLILWGY